MAVAVPSLTGSRFDTVNDTGLALPAGTPAAPSGTVSFTNGYLYVFGFSCQRSGSAPDLSTGFSMSHGGTARTWTYIDQTATWNGGLRVLGAYYYIAVATETVYFVFDPTGGNNSNNQGIIYEFASGFDTGTPIASSAVNTAAAATSLTVTLGAAPSSNDMSIAFFGNSDATSVIDPRTNWTELGEQQGTGTGSDSGAIEGQYKTDQSSEQSASASVSATNRDWGGIHIIVKASAAAVASPYTRPILQSVKRANFF